MNDITIEFGDCRELIKKIPQKTVRMAVTSPPYNLKKAYGAYHDNVEMEDWKKLIDEVTHELYDVLTPDGSFFLNVSPVPDNDSKEIIPLGSIAWEIGKKNGFYLRNMIVWHFNNMQNCVNRLSGRWENILWFVKDLDNYVFNLDDVRLPYITKGDKRLTGEGRNPTDVWYFDRVNNMTKNKLGIDHPCVYPVDMIERIVKMSTNKGDLVLDPFLGSGTSLVACKRLGRRGIGLELDIKWKETIERRLRTEGILQTKLEQGKSSPIAFRSSPFGNGNGNTDGGAGK